MIQIEGPSTQQETELPEDHWNRLYTDEAYFGEFADRPALQLAAETTAFPDAYLKRQANIAYMASVYKTTPEEMEGVYDFKKEEIARAELRKASLSDEGLFEHFKAKFDNINQRNSAGRTLLENVARRTVEDLYNDRQSDSKKPLEDEMSAMSDVLTPEDMVEIRKRSDEITRSLRSAAPDVIKDAQWLFQKMGVDTGILRDEARNIESTFNPAMVVGGLSPAPQAFGGITPPDPANVQEAIDRFADLPDERRQAVYNMASAFATLYKADKGVMHQLVETMGRMASGTVKSTKGVTAETSLRMEFDRIESGQPVLLDSRTGAMVAPVSEGYTGMNFAVPTPEQKQARIDDIRKQLKRIKVERELRNLAETRIDPIQYASTFLPNWVEEGLYGAASSVSYSAMAAIPIVGLPATALALYSQQYEEFMLEDPEMDPQKAMLMAAIAAPIRAFTERIQFLAAFGKALPFTSGLFKRFVKPQQNWLTRTMIIGAAGYTEQNVQELIEGAITPVVQTVFAALDEDTKGFDWKEKVAGLPREIGVNAVATMPLSLIGLGAIGYNEVKFGERYLYDKAIMERMGFSAEAADRVASERDPETAQQVFREEFAKRDPAAVNAATMKIVSDMVEAGNLESAIAMPTIEKQGEDYVVRKWNGEEVARTTDGEAAGYELQQLLVSQEQANWEALNMMVTALRKVKEERGISDQSVIELVDEGTLDAAANMTPEQLKLRLDALEKEMGVSLQPDQIRTVGLNIGELRDGIFRDVSRIVRSDDPDMVNVVIEETIEGDLKRAWNQNLFSKTQTVEWVRQYEQASGENLLADNFDALNEADQTSNLTEAMSTLGVAYFNGNIDRASIPQRLAQFFQRLLVYLQHIMARAVKLQAGLESGQIDARLEQFFAESLGIPIDTVIDSQTRQQTGELVTGNTLATDTAARDTVANSRGEPTNSDAPVTRLQDGTVIVGPDTFAIRAFHGTPHTIDKFSTSKIGTGEGAQVFGWGLYFAENRNVAQDYRDKFAKQQTDYPMFFVLDGNRTPIKDAIEQFGKDWGIIEKIARGHDFDAEFARLDKERAGKDLPEVYRRAFGASRERINKLRQQYDGKVDITVDVIKGTANIYTVDLNVEESQLLDWDKTLGEQNDQIRQAMEGFRTAEFDLEVTDGTDVETAETAYERIAGALGGHRQASQRLLAAGIKGIRYLDQGSRNAGSYLAYFNTEEEAKADAGRINGEVTKTPTRWAVTGTEPQSYNYVIFDDALIEIIKRNDEEVRQSATAAIRPDNAQHAALEERYRNGDSSAYEQAKALVQKQANQAGFKIGPLWHSGSFSLQEDQTFFTDKGAHFGTKQAAEERVRGRFLDDVAQDSQIFQEGDRYFVDEEEYPDAPLNGFSSIEDARTWIAGEENQFADLPDGLDTNMTSVFLSIDNPKRVRDQGNDWTDAIEKARQAGHDGLVYRNEYEDEGSTSYVALDSSQIKSAEPFTYDFAGNLIPLSERFNPTMQMATFAIRVNGQPAGQQSLQWVELSKSAFMPLRTKEGKYKGAPKWINEGNTARSWNKNYRQLRERLWKMIQEGAVGRYWYEDSGRAVLAMFGGDVVEAEKFIELLAIYSPQATVEVNTYFAMRAYLQHANGVKREAFSVKTGSQDAKAISVLYDNQPWAGRKTDNFYKNIMYVLLKELPAAEVAKLKLDKETYEAVSKPVTVDMWVYRAFGFDSDALTDVAGTGAFGFAERELNRFAEELNAQLPAGADPFLPHQIQAMVWTSIKGRSETKSVKDLTERQSIDAGDMVRVKNERGQWVREFPSKDAQKRHMQRWLNNALALPDNELDVSGAAGAFDRFINTMAMRALWEAIPSTKTAEGQAISKIPYADQVRFTEETRRLLLNDRGQDELARIIGLPVAVSKPFSGGYSGGIAPNVVTTIFPDKPSGTYDDDAVRAYARAIQYITRQDAVPWMRYLKPSAVNDASFFIESPAGRVVRRYVTQGEAQDAYNEKVAAAQKALDSALERNNAKPTDKTQAAVQKAQTALDEAKAYKVKGDLQNYGVILGFDSELDEATLRQLETDLVQINEWMGYTQVSPTEVIVVNFRDSETGLPSLTDEDFAAKIQTAYGQKANINHISTTGEYGPVHDWAADQAGEGLLSSSPRFTPDILERLRNWRALSDALQSRYATGGTTSPDRGVATTAAVRPATGDTLRDRLAQMDGDPKFRRERVAAALKKFKSIRDRFSQKRPDDPLSQIEAVAYLEALISMLPPEARKNIGGAEKLAGYKTARGRMNYLLKRIERTDKALEAYLRGAYIEEINELVENLSDTTDKNRTNRSRIGPEAQRIVNYIASVIDLEQKDVANKITGIQAQMNDPEATPEMLAQLQEEWALLDRYGALASADQHSAESLAQSYESLRSVILRGRDQWKAQEKLRLEEYERIRNEAQTELNQNVPTGALPSQLQKSKEESVTWWSKAQNYLEGHLAWYQHLRKIFGESKLANQYETRVRRATNAFEDAQVQAKNNFRLVMIQRMGIGDKINLKTMAALNDALQKLNETRQSKAVIYEGKLVKVERIPMQTAIAAIFENKGNALGFDREELFRLNAELSAIPAGNIARRKFIELERVVANGVPREQRLSELEAIQDILMWSQDDVRVKMERQGYTQDYIDSLSQDFLSNNGQIMLDYLRSQYAQGYDRVNAVYRRIYGMDMPRVRNYAPTAYDTSQTDAVMGPDEMSPSLTGMNAGFVKQRVSHNAPILRMNALSVFQSHMVTQNYWINFAELVRELRGTIASTDVVRAIKARVGEADAERMKKWILAFDRNGLDSGKMLEVVSDMLNRQMGLQAVMFMGYALSTLFKQGSAGMAISLDIGVDEYLRGLTKFFRGQLSASLPEIWNSPTIQRRIEAGYSPEARAVNQSAGMSPSKLLALAERGMLNIAQLDAFLTTFGAAIAFDHHYNAALAQGLSKEAAKSIALDRMDASVRRTAQPASLTDRSLIEANRSPFVRLLYLFASEPRQKFAINYMIAREIAAGRDVKRNLKKFAAGWVAMGVITEALTDIFQSIFRDDDEQEIVRWEDYARAAVMGHLNGLFLAGPALAMAGNAVFGSPVFNSSENPLVRIPTLVMRKDFKPWNWEDASDVVKGIQSYAQLTATVTGSMAVASVAAMLNIAKDAAGLWDKMTKDEE